MNTTSETDEQPHDATQDGSSKHSVLEPEQRAPTLLAVFAVIIVGLCIWEMYNLFAEGKPGHVTLLITRLVIPLGLVAAIWQGQFWARFALAIYCAFIIYANFELILLLPRMFESGDFETIGLVSGYLFGYSFIAYAAVASEKLSVWIAFWREKRKKDSIQKHVSSWQNDS